MEIEISDLLVRFLQRTRADSVYYRVLLTASVFLDFDSRIRELLDKNGPLDGELVRGIAEFASPIELAVMLGSFGSYLSPECFFELFSRVHRETIDSRALRELGMAAAHYHDTHPGSIEIPRELAERLLGSPDEDARLVGLKVLRRFCSDAPTFLASALAALADGTSIERCGAAHELTAICDDRTHRFLSALPDDAVADLRAKLDAASRSDADACTRQNAAHVVRLIGYFEQDRATRPR